MANKNDINGVSPDQQINDPDVDETPEVTTDDAIASDNQDAQAEDQQASDPDAVQDAENADRQGQDPDAAAVANEPFKGVRVTISVAAGKIGYTFFFGKALEVTDKQRVIEKMRKGMPVSLEEKLGMIPWKIAEIEDNRIQSGAFDPDPSKAKALGFDKFEGKIGIAVKQGVGGGLYRFLAVTIPYKIAETIFVKLRGRYPNPVRNAIRALEMAKPGGKPAYNFDGVYESIPNLILNTASPDDKARAKERRIMTWDNIINNTNSGAVRDLLRKMGSAASMSMAIEGKRLYGWTLSADNAMLIFSQNPNATFVATAYEWNKMGRMVTNIDNKILINMPKKANAHMASLKNIFAGGDSPSFQEKKAARIAAQADIQADGFRAICVFDIADTVPIPGMKDKFSNERGLENNMTGMLNPLAQAHSDAYAQRKADQEAALAKAEADNKGSISIAENIQISTEIFKEMCNEMGIKADIRIDGSSPVSPYIYAICYEESRDKKNILRDKNRDWFASVMTQIFCNAYVLPCSIQRYMNVTDNDSGKYFDYFVDLSKRYLARKEEKMASKQATVTEMKCNFNNILKRLNDVRF